MHVTGLLAALAALIAVSLLASGCGDSSADTAASVISPVSDPGVAFGRGSVPDTVPGSFPIPDEAVVGATLTDTNRGLTEMILTFPAAVNGVTTYYEKELVLRGYEITGSNGSDDEWTLEFTGEGIDGVIRLKAGGSGVSSASVRLTDS